MSLQAAFMPGGPGRPAREPEAMRFWVRVCGQASCSAIGPMAPGVCGVLFWRRALPAACIASSAGCVFTACGPGHAAVYNTFNVQRHLISRKILRQFRNEAMSAWWTVTAAA